jgi:hypothetical protein
MHGQRWIRLHAQALEHPEKRFQSATRPPGGGPFLRGYLFVIGVGMTIMAPTGRLNRLSGDRCDDADSDAMVDHAVPFAAAALRSFVTRAAGNGLR